MAQARPASESQGEPEIVKTEGAAAKPAVKSRTAVRKTAAARKQDVTTPPPEATGRPAKPAAGVTTKPATTKPATKSVTTKPAAKASATTPAAKAAVPAAQAPARKPVAKPAAAVAAEAKPAPEAKPAKEHKHKKPRLVRDSFTFPEGDYQLIAALKQRALLAGREIKKSEILRAGLAALAAMDDAVLLKALEGVERIKTGRPSKQGR